MFCFSILVFVLGLSASYTFPVGEQTLTLEQVKRLERWTDDDLQNVWELSGQFEGDIVLLPGQRNGLLNEESRWPNYEIPYELDPEYTDEESAKIVSALNQYDETHIKPRVRLPSDKDYVYVSRTTSGCSSYVGRVGGQQTINLAPRCLTPGTIVHEFLHALGFYHQQSATERDDFVTIVWDNISEGVEYNFNKYEESVVGSYGEVYDYGSVMHYSKTAFSKNGDETIVPRDPDAEIGQRKGLSVIDIKKLNKMYKK